MDPEGRSSDYLELRFAPRWTYISCVRKFVTSFFLIGLADKERAEQISMAASELLENAVKYASDQETTLRIAIVRRNNEVDLCVCNAAEPQQVNILRREFALIHAGPAEEIYLKRMEAAATGGEQSRLGLIRIRYESGATLRLETTETDVSMHAIFSLETP